jgi:hypothetical protein
MNRTRVCTVRLTDDEYDAMQSKLDGTNLTASDLIRAALTRKKVEQRRPKVHTDVLRELSAWGNNLNQVMRLLNTNQQAGQPLPEGLDLDALDRIAAAVERIAKEMRT